MSTIKDQLIKLGTTNPDLRPHIRPVLDALGVKTAAKVTIDLPDKAYALVQASYKKLESDVAKLAKEGEKALNKFGFKVDRFSYGLDRNRKPYVNYVFSSPDPEERRTIETLVSEILGDSYWAVKGNGMKWEAYWEMD